jgi:hypothetical protein
MNHSGVDVYSEVYFKSEQHETCIIYHRPAMQQPTIRR